jgi:hypothetical protein
MAQEFDTVKGAFMLVAMVIITMMLIILGSLGTCAIMIIMDPKINPGVCESMRDPLMQLFQMAFTASIAFAGGRMSAPTQPPPKLPENKDEKEADKY